MDLEKDFMFRTAVITIITCTLAVLILFGSIFLLLEGPNFLAWCQLSKGMGPHDQYQSNPAIEYGVIDERGNPIVPLKYIYVGEFHEGLAVITNGEFKPGETRANWKYGSRALKGFIDRNGKVVIEPKYAEASDFSDGLAKVEIANLFSKRSVLIDHSGSVVNEQIKNRKSTVGSSASGKNYDTKLNEPTIVMDGKEYGLADKTGKIIMKPQFGSISRFENGYAQATNDYGDVGLISSTGKVLIEPRFFELGSVSEGKVAAKSKSNGKWGFVDLNDRVVIPFEYSSVSSFHDNRATVSRATY